MVVGRGWCARQVDLLGPQRHRDGHALGAGDAVADVVRQSAQSMTTWSGSSTASVPSIRLTLPMKSATKRVAGVS
jgi:hypothetical protein